MSVAKRRRKRKKNRWPERAGSCSDGGADVMEEREAPPAMVHLFGNCSAMIEDRCPVWGTTQNGSQRGPLSYLATITFTATLALKAPATTLRFTTAGPSGVRPALELPPLLQPAMLASRKARISAAE